MGLLLLCVQDIQPDGTHLVHKNNDSRMYITKGRQEIAMGVRLKSSFDTLSELSKVTTVSAADAVPSGLQKVTTTGGFLWPNPKRRNVGSSYRARTSYARHGSGKNTSEPLDETASVLAREYPEHMRYGENENTRARESSTGHNSYKLERTEKIKRENHLDRLNSYDSPEKYHSQELSSDVYRRKVT